MSQYIQGVVDYIPMIQPFQPDFNLFTKVLETKEAGYKAGYDKLSSLYGTLLNSPMSRQDNIELRNRFFKDISSQIQKISSLDLSKSQNVEAAYKVFQPLIDDNYILKDMSYTKNAYNAIETGEALKNCLDPKKCPGQYWEGGKKLIQYQIQSFKEAPREKTLRMETPRFIPKVNLPKQAMDYAKEMGFKVTLPSYTPDGRYSISTTNGPNMIPGLSDIFMSVFGEDPAAIDYYTALSQLNRYDFAYSDENIQKYGSKEAAEMFYLDEMHRSIVASTAEQLKIAKDQETLASNKKATIDAVITSKGIDPNDSNDQALIKDRYQSMVDQMISGSNAQTYESELSSISDDGFDSLDLDSKIYRIDNVTSRSLMQRALYQAANDYAMQTMEVKKTADEFALKDYDHMLAVRRMGIQDKYARELYKYQKSIDILAESYKTKNGATPDGANPDNKGFTRRNPTPGGSAEKVNLQESDKNEVKVATDDAINSANNLLEKGYQEFMSIINTKDGAFTSGGIKMNPQVREYYRAKMKEIFGVGKAETVTTVSNNQTGSYSTGSTLLVSGVLPYKEETKNVTVVKGGQLRDDGSRLHGNFLDHADFANASSEYSWENISKRLTDFFQNDNLGKYGIAYEPELGFYGAMANYNKAKANYDGYIKAQKDNNLIVHNQLMGSAAGLSVLDEISEYNETTSGLDVGTPSLIVEHTKASLQKMATEGGALLTFPEFKEIYANSEAAKNVAERVVQEVYNTYPGYGGGPWQYSYDDAVKTVIELLNDDAEDVYKEYMDQFTKIYNQSTDAAVKDVDTKGFVPLSAFYNFNDAGSGIQANPYGATVDSAYPGDIQAVYFKDLFDNYLSQNADNPAIEIYASSPGKLVEKRLFTNDEDVVDSNAPYMKALQGYRSEFDFNREADDKTRLLFDFEIHPIIFNDPNKVAFSFSAIPQYYDINKGSNNARKYMSEVGDNFVIVVDKNKMPEIANSEALKVLNQGPYTIAMRANKRIDINDYPLGGTATIVPYGDSYVAKRSVNYIDQNDFQLRQYTEVAYMGQQESLEDFSKRNARFLAENSQNVHLAQSQIKALNPNLIRNPDILDSK